MEIKVEQLADAIRKELGIYSEAVTTEMKKVIEVVAEETAEELRNASPRRQRYSFRGKGRKFPPGSYAKGWTAKNSYTSTRTKRNTVHNRTHYQLTHLLEHGHAKRGGGRVSGVAHIEPVEKSAMKKLEDGIKEAAERAT